MLKNNLNRLQSDFDLQEEINQELQSQLESSEQAVDSIQGELDSEKANSDGLSYELLRANETIQELSTSVDKIQNQNAGLKN